VPKMEIRWPSGIRQTLKDVVADQILEVNEPAANHPALEQK
jgi:ASPIC and UnbV